MVRQSPIYARAHQLDEHVRELGLRRRRDKAALAQALLEIKERGYYRLLGHASMAAYGRTVEGLGASTTSELLKVAAGVRELPQIRAAFESGYLPADKASVLVGAATAEDEAEWLERARDLDACGLRALQRGAEPSYRRTLRWAREQTAWVEDAVRVIRETGGPTSFSAAVAEVCRRFTQGEAVGTGGAPGSKRGARPLLVFHQEPGGTLTRESSVGTVPVDPETEAWARREGAVVDLRDGPPPVPEGEPKRAIPPAIRRYVEGRDGGRCQVPGCHRQTWLEADHFEGWKRGHDPQRIGLLCWDHHDERTRGFLKVEVDPDGVRRFYLRDDTYLGVAGQRTRADVAGFVPTNSEGFVPTKPAGFVHTKPPRRKPAAEPGVPQRLGPEVEDALKALVALEIKPREARARLQRVLAERPELPEAEAGEILRALLAYG